MQTEDLQKCMVSNKEYYAPVLEEGDSFAESKEKFDTATSSQSPQELKGDTNSGEADKDEASEPAAGDDLSCIHATCWDVHATNWLVQ